MRKFFGAHSGTFSDNQSRSGGAFTMNLSTKTNLIGGVASFLFTLMFAATANAQNPTDSASVEGEVDASVDTGTAEGPEAPSTPVDDSQGSTLIEVDSFEDTVILGAISVTHHDVTLQAEYVTEARDGLEFLMGEQVDNFDPAAEPPTKKRAKKKYDAGKAKYDSLMFDSGGMLEAFTNVLNNKGHRNPEELQTWVLPHMEKYGCNSEVITEPATTTVNDEEVSYEKVVKIKFSGDGCQKMLDDHYAVFDAKVAQAKDGPLKDNAIKLRRGAAGAYTPGDGVLLMQLPLLELNAALPESERFWKVGGGNLLALAREAKEANAGDFDGRKFIDADDESGGPAVLYSEEYPNGHPGELEKNDGSGATVGGVSVTRGQLDSGEAVIVIGEAGGNAHNTSWDGVSLSFNVTPLTLIGPNHPAFLMFGSIAVDRTFPNARGAAPFVGGELGVGGVASGGEQHGDTDYDSTKDRTAGMAALRVGFRPLISKDKDIRLLVMGRGLILFHSDGVGGGGLLDIGPVFGWGDGRVKHAFSLTATLGGIAYGGSVSSYNVMTDPRPREVQNLSGFAVGGTVGYSLRFGPKD